MLRLSHIGLKVKDMDKSVGFYQELLQCESLKTYEADNFKAVLLKCRGNTIELIENPQAVTGDKTDGVIEHLAFKVDDIEEEIRRLKAKGVECISQNIENFGDIKLFFFRGPDGEMLEFLE